MTKVVVIGAGATGRRAAKQLLTDDRDCRVVLIDHDRRVVDAALAELGSRASGVGGPYTGTGVDALIIATRTGSHAELAQTYLNRVPTIVSVGDSIEDVAGLLDLDDPAAANGCRLVVGAGMMPGLSDVLASHGKRWFDAVREIHVSKFGTGGPACARQHHRALKGLCFDWRNGQWQRRPGGSGRELAWFPGPVEAADCYRAGLSDPLLLIRCHPNIERLTSRMAATRRDRLTMQLPMLRSPHPEGLLGAIRVEMRGTQSGQQVEVVLGSAEAPAVAAGKVAAAAVATMLGENEDKVASFGARGLAEWVEPVPFLRRLAVSGLRAEIFVGADGESA